MSKGDIFSQEIFVELLQNPKCTELFGEFLKLDNKNRMITFWIEVNGFRNAPALNKKKVGEIYFNFIHDGGDEQLDLSEEMRNEAIESLKKPSQTMFDVTQKLVTEQMFTENYRDFVRFLIQKKAQAQLRRSARVKDTGLLGLGDCFCLIDISQTDAPIIAASDCFIKVTGYSRAEIIMRNCMFLQGERTDQQSVSKIHEAIKSQTDVTEILLSYKKDGTPFWNLFFLCPLLNFDGSVKLYLGGLVDVTKNIGNFNNLQALIKFNTPSIFTQISMHLHKGKTVSADHLVHDSTLSVEAKKKLSTDTYSSFLVFEATSFNVAFASSHFLRVFGFTQEEIQKKTPEKLFGQWTERKVIHDLRTSFHKGLPASQTLVLYDKSSNPMKCHIHITPIKHQEAKTCFYMAVIIPDRVNQTDSRRLNGLAPRKFIKKEEGCVFQ